MNGFVLFGIIDTAIYGSAFFKDNVRNNGKHASGLAVQKNLFVLMYSNKIRLFVLIIGDFALAGLADSFAFSAVPAIFLLDHWVRKALLIPSHLDCSERAYSETCRTAGAGVFIIIYRFHILHS